MTIQTGTTHAVAMTAAPAAEAPRLPPPPLVYVRWVDSAQHYDWAERGTPSLGLFTCDTIGWLVDEDADRLVLTNTLALESASGTEHVNGMMAIPQCAIRERRSMANPLDEG